MTYGYRSGGLPWALKDEFYYDITVKSDLDVLLQRKGAVAVVPAPKKGIILDNDGVWNNFVAYTDQVDDALVRDLKQTSR